MSGGRYGNVRGSGGPMDYTVEDYDSMGGSSAGMEAGYDTLEEEEEYAKMCAEEEDREEKKRMKRDYQDEVEFRKQLKREKKKRQKGL